MSSLRDSLAQELLQYATPELKRRHFDEAEEELIPYKEINSGFVYFKGTPTGTATVPLTNFAAYIVRDTEEDDGADTKRVLTIKAQIGDTVRSFDVTGTRFQSMQWVLENLGTKAVVYPGCESHARTAILLLSKDVEQKRVITHTGWRQFDEVWFYLHADGAIGVDGVDSSIMVSLHSDLMKFQLPAPPKGVDLIQAIGASIKMLKVGPLRLTCALHSAVYRAPLGDVDFGLWIGGGSGAGKSVVSALAEAHYGASFTHRNAPGNWSSTENALEALAFCAKDVLLMIDDFAPTDKQSRDRLNRKADRIFRAQGNQSGRQRQNADGSLRSTKPPRGLIVSTGEDVPPGKSLRGRMTISQLDREGANSLNWKEVSRAQKDVLAGKYAAAMAGYIQWLARDYEAIRRKLPSQITTLRGLTLNSRAHARTPENAANLGIGLAYFLRFALESEAITKDEALKLLYDGWQAIGELALEQVQYQEASDPVRMFIEFLSSALATGRAYVVMRVDGSAPPDAQKWGWRDSEVDLTPQGQKIGWLDSEDLYLDPNAARAVVLEIANRTDQQLVISSSQLWQQLNSKGYLLSTEIKTKRQTYPVRRTCEGKSQSVLHLSAELFEQGDAEKPDKSDNSGANAEDRALTDVGYLETIVLQSDIEVKEPDSEPQVNVGLDGQMSGSDFVPDICKSGNGNNNKSNVGNVGNLEPAPIPEAEELRADEQQTIDREIIEI
jgi:hypothetical protein